MIYSMRHLKCSWKISIICILLLSACESSRHPVESEVENPTSEVLHFLLDVNDIPSNWDFVKISQPSQVTWLQQENLLDSASIYVSGDYRLKGEKYYANIFHVIAQYSDTMSERNDVSLHSFFGGNNEHREIEPPLLLNFENETNAKCFETGIFYQCSVNASYQFINSYVSVVTPKEMGIEGLKGLLNSILKVIDGKITNKQN